MNTFVQAVQNTLRQSKTANGAETYDSSTNAVVDLFYLIGASRSMSDEDLSVAFNRAFAQDPERAAKVLLWGRDVRGGAGERRAFRSILVSMAAISAFDPYMTRIVEVTATFGRWDDLLVLLDTRHAHLVYAAFKKAILVDHDGLAAKWLPRKGVVAAQMRKAFEMTPKNYRKTLVNLTKVVEQHMCAKDWEGINFSHVPSVASSRYQKAFWRNAPEKYAQYIAELSKPESERDPSVKVNAAAIFPHEIVMQIQKSTDKRLSVAQWEALPNYVDSVSARILPMVDVSGSMNSNLSGSTRAIDVSVGMGLYFADKQTGPFKDMVLTFSEMPRLEILAGDISQKIAQVVRMDWGMNTNLQRAFHCVLLTARNNGVAPEDMPTHILILSDMEFDACVASTNLDGIQEQYRASGYDMPKIVFWNLNGRLGNVPASQHVKDVALVSGFSPAVANTILAAEFDNFTPRAIAYATIDNARYDVFKMSQKGA